MSSFDAKKPPSKISCLGTFNQWFRKILPKKYLFGRPGCSLAGCTMLTFFPWDSHTSAMPWQCEFFLHFTSWKKSIFYHHCSEATEKSESTSLCLGPIDSKCLCAYLAHISGDTVPFNFVLFSLKTFKCLFLKIFGTEFFLQQIRNFLKK